MSSVVEHPAGSAYDGSLAMEDLLPLVYAELKRIAARELRGELPGHTLCTTALVHEAWVELARLDRIRWHNRSHYLHPRHDYDGPFHHDDSPHNYHGVPHHHQAPRYHDDNHHDDHIHHNVDNGTSKNHDHDCSRGGSDHPADHDDHIRRPEESEPYPCGDSRSFDHGPIHACHLSRAIGAFDDGSALDAGSGNGSQGQSRGRRCRRR